MVNAALWLPVAWRLAAQLALQLLPPSQSYVHRLQQEAAAGDPAAEELRLQLLRLAAAYVAESCEGNVEDAVHRHLLLAAAT